MFAQLTKIAHMSVENCNCDSNYEKYTCFVINSFCVYVGVTI